MLEEKETQRNKRGEAAPCRIAQGVASRRAAMLGSSCPAADKPSPAEDETARLSALHNIRRLLGPDPFC